MENFEVGFRTNRRFNHLVAANFTLEGAGAAVILGAIFLNHRPGLVLGLILLLAGAFFLFLDLGSPLKSWRSVFNPKGSWISRGALFLGFLVVLSALYIGMPGIGSSGPGVTLKVVMGIFAILTMTYTGFLVSSMGSIPFWNSRLVPLIFLCNALATGMAVLNWIQYLTGSVKKASTGLMGMETFLLIVILAVSIAHLLLANKKGSASKESVGMLTRGKYKQTYWGGGIGLGLLLPLCIIIGGDWVPYFVLPVMAAARIGGDYCYRLALLKTGVYESVLARESRV